MPHAARAFLYLSLLAVFAPVSSWAATQIKCSVIQLIAHDSPVPGANPVIEKLSQEKFSGDLTEIQKTGVTFMPRLEGVTITVTRAGQFIAGFRVSVIKGTSVASGYGFPENTRDIIRSVNVNFDFRDDEGKSNFTSVACYKSN